MVITPQAYAKNRDSKDLRQTWLAKSVDLLLVRFPMCLKVGADSAPSRLCTYRVLVYLQACVCVCVCAQTCVHICAFECAYVSCASPTHP
eukprot:scaffold69000_cov22-Tisochrysis_lutea.AAC.2